MRGRYIAVTVTSALLTLPGVGTGIAAQAAMAAPGVAIVAQPDGSAPPSTDPYVVECLEGDNGMATWSNGTTAFSEQCMNGYHSHPRQPGGPRPPLGPMAPMGPVGPGTPMG